MNKIISFSKTLIHSLGYETLSAYFELTKLRLVLMVLLSTITGYFLGVQSAVNLGPFCFTLFGTALVAAGSMALNQYFECETDSKMIRTQNRPLPSGKIEMKQAFAFGMTSSAAGFLMLIFGANLLAALCALLTWAGYLFCYTPLKTKTSLSTIVGAVPGALPPIIGWASASGSLNFQSFILFLIVFFWQLPHFLAIAWMYRGDYERAGLPMLSVIDKDGKFVARQMILNMCALMPVSLLPTIFHMTGTLYFFSAFGLGILFAAVVIYASANLDQRARYVLRASIIYLGLLLLLMNLDKI